MYPDRLLLHGITKPIRTLLGAALLCGLGLLIRGSVSPSEAQPPALRLIDRLIASADAYVVSDVPDVNAGDAPFLEIGGAPDMGGGVSAEAWLAFDLTSIPTSATVEQATLRTFVRPGGFGPDNTAGVRRVLTRWDEATLTWNLRPSLDAVFSSQVFAGDATVLTWDLTSLVGAWVSRDMRNYGLALQSLPERGDWVRFLYSRESPYPPEMWVTYTVSSRSYVFDGLVQGAASGTPEDHPLGGIRMRLYTAMPWEEGLGSVAVETSTGRDGAYRMQYVFPIDYPPLTYTVAIAADDYRVVGAMPGDGGSATPEGTIRYPNTAPPGHYPHSIYRIAPLAPREWFTYTFSGIVRDAQEDMPVPEVEVVLYGAEDPDLPQQVLAGASTGPDGAFRLVVAVPPETRFPHYVLQVADTVYRAVGATPGAGGTAMEDHRIRFSSPSPGEYRRNTFAVRAGVARSAMPSLAPAQATEWRPVVAVLYTPICACGTTSCVTITNPSVLSAFGDTLFGTSGDSVRNYFLENSQGHFGLQQAGLFQVVPADDPNTTANETLNCPIEGWTPEQHRAYMARRVLGQQISFNFAAHDRDGDGVVERHELIVLLAATDPHTGNARVRTSDPARVQVGNVGVEVFYIMVQPGTDFYTIAHEVAHTLPYASRSGEPGDMYGGQGNAGAYGLMDNHCHGRTNWLDPNTPYTPTQHIAVRLPHLDPRNKIALGWITPTIVAGAGGWQRLSPVAAGGSVFRLMSFLKPQEYFLVESRWPAASQYETQLRDSGLAIWHINEAYLPDQRRAIALERAGGGANSGAGSDFCSDDNDTTALWDGSHGFHGASSPSSDWYSGTNSGMAVLCVSAPSADVPAYLSAAYFGTVLPEDVQEPDNVPEVAQPVTAGFYDRTLHAPCDTDVYTMTHWKQAYITVTVSAFHDSGHTQPAPAPTVRIAEDGFYTWYSFEGVGSASGLLPFAGVVNIEVYGSAVPVYYRMQVSSSQPTIPPDRFDDEQPAGEVRNDSFLHSAVITDEINEQAVLIPGLQIADLNLEKASDVDYFTLQLPPKVHPTTGYSECLPAGDPRYGDLTSQGSLVVRVWPYFKRPFTITAYTSAETPVTNPTRQGPLEISFECPHDFFHDGKVTLRVDDLSGQVNFFEIDVNYGRWARLVDFPEWLLLTDPPLFKPIPAYYDPRLRWIYPAALWAQEALLSGMAPLPLPREYLPFYWEGGLPLAVDVVTLPGYGLNLGLYDAGQNLIATARPLGGGVGASSVRLQAPELPPGWYALGVDGGETLTEYAVQFHVWRTYLPMIVRRSAD